MQVGTAPTEPTLSMMVWPHTAEVLQDGVPAEDAVGDQPEVAQLLLEAISRSTAHQPTTGSQAKLSIDRSLEESSPTCESPESPWIGEVRQLQQQMDAEDPLSAELKAAEATETAFSPLELDCAEGSNR